VVVKLSLLQGLFIVDLSMFIAGPFGTMVLADLGANVVKVEPLTGDPVRTNRMGAQFAGENAQFQSYNRNKRSVAIDLKAPEGRAVVDDLVRTADVVFDNFRPGVLERLGLNYDRLRTINPRIISCSVSAFGQSGPWSDRPGYDLIVQALGGGMSLTGHPQTGPAHIPFHLGDTAAGLYAAVAILAAVAERARTGVGRLVELSLLDAQLALLGDEVTNFSVDGRVPQPHGAGHPNFFPYQAFAAADGPIVVAAVGVEKFWQSLCRVIGHPELTEDARFMGNDVRVRNRHLLEPVLARAFAKRTRAEWVAALTRADIPAAPILSVPEAMTTPPAVHRGMVQELEIGDSGKVAVAGNPIHAQDAARPFCAAPGLGADTDAILGEIGYEAAKIDALRRAGVLR
jgi:crotonobetainyl-CoA:carnitine CoA-transferase CaiB-like acyl-CoA transferase